LRGRFNYGLSRGYRGYPGEEEPKAEKPRGVRKRLVYEIRNARTNIKKSLKIYIRLLRYSKPYLHLAAFILIISMITSLISILPVQIMGVAVDTMWTIHRERAGNDTQESTPARTSEAQPATRPGGVPSFSKSLPVEPLIRRMADYISRKWLLDQDPLIITFYVLAALYLFLNLSTTGITIVRGFIMARLGQALIFDMRNDVYRHLQKLSLKYYEENKTGDIMSRVINDVNSLQSVIIGPVITLLSDMLRLVYILYFCISWDWRLTLLSLAIGPILLVATAWFGVYMRKTYRLIRRKIGELNALLQDNLSGIRIIKGFAREDYEYGRFESKSDENRRLNVRIARLMTLFSSGLRVLTQAGSLLVLGYGGIKVLKGTISPGMFITFLRYIPMLYGPIMGLTRFYTSIQSALASVERVFEVLDTEPDIADKKDAIKLPVIRGEVEFKDVSFCYSDDVEVLKDINLKVSPGQMIAFVGPSGAGKTTAVNLVPRFYDPVKGDILVDGHNLKDIKIKSLREQMGIVLQEPFLFNDTLKSNIAYGKLGATDDEIIHAAVAANAHDFIKELPNGYETIIGERGIKLSGGQRQRVSVARAILANPRILILDEATSSVDTETEKLIQDAIQRLVKDRTTFVIAHRLSTIHNADLIIVLEKGCVVEMGRHDELLANEGLYSRLHKVQFRSPDAVDTDEEQRPSRSRRQSIQNDGGDKALDQVIKDEIKQTDDW
jgi:subfamily B ATP-binding cassette protein MsbA